MINYFTQFLKSNKHIKKYDKFDYVRIRKRIDELNSEYSTYDDIKFTKLSDYANILLKQPNISKIEIKKKECLVAVVIFINYKMIVNKNDIFVDPMQLLRLFA